MSARQGIAKLMAPGAARIVSRPRVNQALARMVEAGHVWIAAPGGYGKSAAVADFAVASGRPHIWYRLDEGDGDIASFFHYLALASGGVRLSSFGSEYADQPHAYARRFFRSWCAGVDPATILILDDVQAASSAEFRTLLPILIEEMPDPMRAMLVARTLPPRSLSEALLKCEIGVADQKLLEFTPAEARALIERRLGRPADDVDASAVRGWAVGLVMLADRSAGLPSPLPAGATEDLLFDTLARQFLDALPEAEREMLTRLSLLPEISQGLATAMTGSSEAGRLIDELHERQYLIDTGAGRARLFHLHDLLRDLLAWRIDQKPAAEQARLRRRAALILARAGRPDEAIDLALAARAWRLARLLIQIRADVVIGQGRRATLLGWCGAMPEAELDAWLSYWLGVAHLPDDAKAVAWLERAWAGFERSGDRRGLALAAARAVLVKTDSWRTHEGLATWTRRMLALGDAPSLAMDEAWLVRIGRLHAADYAEDYDEETGAALAHAILDRLNVTDEDGSDPSLRLLASAAVIEHAGSAGRRDLFEQAVDAVAAELGDAAVSPLALGLWLIAFGSVSGRYFRYAREGFPYDAAEPALRQAIAIGESEGLRSVEFGALYHLQLQLKLRNEMDDYGRLVTRLAAIADSRNHTQVAVSADCEAALLMRRGNLPDAFRANDRVMAAIEAADEPPIERWPHFLTRFQLLIADGRPDEAAAYLGALAGLFDGGVRLRTEACIRLAVALAARVSKPRLYPERLAAAFGAMREAGWTSILADLPELLARCCGEALEQGIEEDFCRRLIGARGLRPPPDRPRGWPWPLRLHVLGGFAAVLDDAPLDLGAKAPLLALDMLRALAVARDHVLPLTALHDALWPDADGDQAKAACDQALHRLRKLLGRPDLVVLRQGQLRLDDRVWVDLDDWRRRAARDEGEAFEAFPGPLLPHLSDHPLWTPAARRLRRDYLALAERLAARRPGKAAAIRQRALDHYPEAPAEPAPILAVPA